MKSIGASRRHAQRTAGALALLVVAAGYLRAQPANDIDVRPQRVELIRPGTVIDKSAPRDWTHLIVKSHPRIRDEDANRVNDTTFRLSSIIFTAFTANVKADSTDPSRFRIDRIAVGVGTNIDGVDTVVSPDSQKQLGAKLGLLARQVLSRTYERQQDNIIVARSATSAIVDAPVVMKRGKHNRFVTFRYLLLADASTGALETLVWLVDLNSKGEVLGAVGDIEVLPPSKILDAVLTVDSEQITLGVPSDLAFGVSKIPQGRFQLAMPEDLRPLAGKARFEPGDFSILEGRLRAQLKSESQRAN